MTFKFTFSLVLLFLLLSLGQATTAQTVTVNRKAGQANPTTSPVVFTVKFSAAINVATFTPSTIVLSGTATGKKVTAIMEVAPSNGTTFEVTVTATSGTGTIVATIPVAVSTATSSIFGNTGSDPSRIKIDGSGNLYITNYLDNNVTKMTAAGVTTIFGTTAAGPLGLTIDGAGNVYTANYLDNSVTKISAAGVITKVFAKTGANPSAITIDAAGNLYTSNGSATVTKITAAGVSTLIFGNTGSNPTDIITDAAGNIYTANDGDNTVSKITSAGVSTKAFAQTGGWPFGIIIDGSGNLYTTNQELNNISKITAAGVSAIFSTTGNNPNYLAIDGYGNLYTPNSDNNVSKITPAGVSSIIGTTGAFPNDVALDALGNVYATNNSGNTVTKIKVSSGIALSGSSTPSNSASTSSDNGYVLPVNLVSFTAVSNNCTATLNWQTSAEINSSYYSIETSKDAKSFGEVGKITSKNSATGATYATAIKTASGTNYYRLKMVDADGNYAFSKIIVVTVIGNCGTSVQAKVSPNPAKDFINVEGLANGNQLTLINAAGILVSSIKATGNTQCINISKFAHGIYMLRIEAADGSIQTVKVVKL